VQLNGCASGREYRIISPRIPFIAVVDDDESVREALARLLRSNGMDSKGYGSADAFLDTGRWRRPDCLVLDIQMPEVSGLALQEQLVAEREVIPIICMSAHENNAVRDRALGLGAVAFLYKPFSDQVLFDAIAFALARQAHDKEAGA
jgi:FixJ family two-component response regulator